MGPAHASSFMVGEEETVGRPNSFSRWTSRGRNAKRRPSRIRGYRLDTLKTQGRELERRKRRSRERKKRTYRERKKSYPIISSVRTPEVALEPVSIGSISTCGETKWIEKAVERPGGRLATVGRRSRLRKVAWIQNMSRRSSLGGEISRKHFC